MPLNSTDSSIGMRGFHIVHFCLELSFQSILVANKDGNHLFPLSSHLIIRVRSRRRRRRWTLRRLVSVLLCS